MSDVVYVTSDASEVIMNAKLASRVVYSGVSLEKCDECSQPIPEKRRLAIKGCKLCIFCQSQKERK